MDIGSVSKIPAATMVSGPVMEAGSCSETLIYLSPKQNIATSPKSQACTTHGTLLRWRNKTRASAERAGKALDMYSTGTQFESRASLS
jgi:hypothetical protein